jgi:hypothetical protein
MTREGLKLKIKSFFTTKWSLKIRRRESGIRGKTGSKISQLREHLHVTGNANTSRVDLARMNSALRHGKVLGNGVAWFSFRIGVGEDKVCMHT